MSKKIYVASSWRNPHQPEAVARIRAAGHEVYDFRNPPSGSHGFNWIEIDPAWKDWTPAAFIEALDSPIAEKGFQDDLGGMEWANAFVLLLPCGRSAHLEAGWAIGRGIPTYIVIGEHLDEAELMYKLATRVVPSLDDVIAAFANDMSRTITVCSKCFRACCWHGQFYCDEYRSAGTLEKTVDELRALRLEHERYWTE